MLRLPLEIVENIIIQNQYILSTYNKVLKAATCINDIDIDLSIRLYNFLIQKTTIDNIYKSSPWYRYFIKCKDFKDHNTQIKKIANDFKLFNSFINYTNNMNNVNPFFSDNNNNIYDIPDYKIIDYIETIVDINKLDVLAIKVLTLWKLNLFDLDSFIILFLVLSSGNIFKSHIYNHLTNYFKLHDNNNNNNTDKNNIVQNIPCYFKESNKFIPLLQAYIGMGYTFNIGFDISICNTVGFIYGGSNGHEFDYFNNKLLTYFEKTINQKLKYIKQNNKITNNEKLLLLIDYNMDDKPLSEYNDYTINYE